MEPLKLDGMKMTAGVACASVVGSVNEVLEGARGGAGLATVGLSSELHSAADAK